MLRRRALIAVLVGILAACWWAGPYFVAHFEYERAVRLEPRDRRALEEILILTSKQRILCSEITWGGPPPRDHRGYCMRYLVLGRERIDAVFDEQGLLVRLVSAYE